MTDEFEKKLNDHLKSMIEVSFEYIGWNDKEVNSIHILCSTEESVFFSFFFNIHGHIVDRHLVNKYLQQQCNVSEEQQSAADAIGTNDLQNVIKLFEENNREVPHVIKLTYFPLANKMEVDFDYENRLIGTDLMEEDLVEQWMELLKQ